MILHHLQFKCVRTTGSQAALAGLYEEGWLDKMGIVIAVDNVEFVRELRGYDQKIPIFVINTVLSGAAEKYFALNVTFWPKPTDQDFISLVRETLSPSALSPSAQRNTLRA
jgi:hypothetical protein